MKLKIKSKLSSILTFSGFILASAIAVVAVIAPLWLFATKKPRLYSALTLALAAALVLFKTILWTKKRGIKKLLLGAAKISIAAAGVFFCLFFLSKGSRIIALILALLAAAAFCLVLALEKKIHAKG